MSSSSRSSSRRRFVKIGIAQQSEQLSFDEADDSPNPKSRKMVAQALTQPSSSSSSSSSLSNDSSRKRPIDEVANTSRSSSSNSSSSSNLKPIDNSNNNPNHTGRTTRRSSGVNALLPVSLPDSSESTTKYANKRAKGSDHSNSSPGNNQTKPNNGNNSKKNDSSNSNNTNILSPTKSILITKSPTDIKSGKSVQKYYYPEIKYR